jgi:hypothetical protein
MKIYKCPDCKAQNKPKCVEALVLSKELIKIRKSLFPIIENIEKIIDSIEK